jgi:hypothetical protein
MKNTPLNLFFKTKKIHKKITRWETMSASTNATKSENSNVAVDEPMQTHDSILQTHWSPKSPGDWTKSDIDAAGVPVETPHPHFPCVVLRGSSITPAYLHGVMTGIQNISDTVIPPTSTCEFKGDDQSAWQVSATVFLGSERISITARLFVAQAMEDDTQKNFYHLLLQLVCSSGYGWNFYTVWDSILDALRKGGYTFHRYLPVVDVDHDVGSKNNQHQGTQPSLSEQLRTLQIPTKYSSTSNPPLQELPHYQPEDLELPAQPADTTENRINTVRKLLGAPYDEERCTGIELLESNLNVSEVLANVQPSFYACLASSSKYPESRIRALSLLHKMVRHGYISSSSEFPLDTIRQGLEQVRTEADQKERQNYAFQCMVHEYEQLAIKALRSVSEAFGLVPGSRLMNTLDGLCKSHSIPM